MGDSNDAMGNYDAIDGDDMNGVRYNERESEKCDNDTPCNTPYNTPSTYSVNLNFSPSTPSIGVTLTDANSGKFMDLDDAILRLQEQRKDTTNTAPSTEDSANRNLINYTQSEVTGSTLTPSSTPSSSPPSPPNPSISPNNVYVSRCVSGSQGWLKGIREGDVLIKTQATVGDGMWTKKGIEGVQSSLLSRLPLTPTTTLHLSRPTPTLTTPYVTESFTLPLKRPIGIQLRQDVDQHTGTRHVTVSSVSKSPSSANRGTIDSIEVGDRVVEVEAALGGKMWPHSTVDGVVAAVNGRLPGAEVRIRFERVVEVGEFDRTKGGGGTEGIKDRLGGVVESFKILKGGERGGLAPTGSKTHRVLLERTREVLDGYIKKGRDSSNGNGPSNVPSLAADKVLTVLAEADAQLDAQTLTCVMNAYLAAGDHVGAVKAFSASTGLTSNGFTEVNSMFDGGEGGHVWYGKEGKTHRIAANVYALSLTSGTALLKAFSVAGDFKAAVKVLKDMLVWKENGGIKVDGVAWNVCLSAVRERGDYGACVKLWEVMPEKEKSRESWNTMLKVHCDMGEVERAREIVEAMKKGGKDRLLDKVAVTTLMRGYVDKGLTEEAMSVFTECAFYDIAYDAQTYNTILRGLMRDRDFERSEALMERMEGEGIKPDYMTYSYLMKGLLDVKKYNEVLKVFDAALDVDPKVVRNVGLYTTAITAAARTRNFDAAMGYIGKMKLEGITPNTKALTSLVNACIMCGRPEVGMEVYEGMKERGLEVDSRAKSTVIRALVQMERWDEAVEVLEEGKSGGKDFKGNEMMEGYEGVMRGLCEKGEWGRGMDVLKIMMRYGFVPGKKFMISVMRGCNVYREQGGGEEEVLKFLFDVIDSLGDRKVAISGSFYAYLLHRISDLVYQHGWESQEAKVFMEVGKAVRGAKLRDNNQLAGGKGTKRGGGKWGAVVEDLKGKGRKADDLTMGLLLVRVGGDEGEKVGTAERRIARCSGAGRGRRAEV